MLSSVTKLNKQKNIYNLLNSTVQLLFCTSTVKHEISQTVKLNQEKVRAEKLNQQVFNVDLYCQNPYTCDFSA